jgi:hypothetical protein
VLFVTSEGEGGSLGDFSVDLDMLSASVEASKIGDRVVQAVARPPADVDLAPLVSAAAVTGQMSTLSYFSTADAVAIVPTVKKPVTEPQPEPDVAPKVIVVPQLAARERDEVSPTQRPIVVTPGTAPGASASMSKRTPVHKQWWLWTIVGLAVAGGVTAGVLVGTARVGDVSVNAQW